MQELIDAIVKHLHDKWISIATAAAFMFVGWLFGKRRAIADWKNKEFLDRLNVSLNSIRDGKLQIRTILEKSCHDIFLNSVATETIINLSRKTTEQDSIIPLPKNENWYYLNSVLNEISEAFAEGQLKRDLGMPVTAERYLICLTNECAGEMKTRKLRAMLIQKLLEKLPIEQPKFESPHHSKRWKTLQQLAIEFPKSPEKFLEIEIVVG